MNKNELKKLRKKYKTGEIYINIVFLPSFCSRCLRPLEYEHAWVGKVGDKYEYLCLECADNYKEAEGFFKNLNIRLRLRRKSQ